jgi:hypothetical protein
VKAAAMNGVTRNPMTDEFQRITLQKTSLANPTGALDDAE